MASWRLARSLEKLRDEINERCPGRNKISDGTIGNAEHAARASDHNPNDLGVVTAMDITHDPAKCPGQKLADHLVALARAGDKRIKYVIWNRDIYNLSIADRWRPYNGANPHTHHVHLSVSASPSQYDRTDTWWPSDKEEENEMQLKDRVELTAAAARNLNAAGNTFKEGDEVTVEYLLLWGSIRTQQAEDRAERLQETVATLEDKVDQLLARIPVTKS